MVLSEKGVNLRQVFVYLLTHVSPRWNEEALMSRLGEGSSKYGNDGRWVLEEESGRNWKGITDCVEVEDIAREILCCC